MTHPRLRNDSPAAAFSAPLALTLMAVLALASGCGGGDGGEDVAPPEESAAAAAAEAPPRVRVLNTVPRFQLRDQDGRPFGAQNLEGKVWIATFIFTRCAQTCPMQTAEMVNLQRRLAGHPRKQSIHFVSFTVDPAHDTPPVLKKYAAEAGSDLTWWSYLTGKRNELWALSRDGFKLPVSQEEADPESVITHSQNFILVDRARRVRGHYDGLEEAAREKLIQDLEIVLDDPPGPIGYRKEVPMSRQQGSPHYEPPELRETAWLEERAEAQMATRPRFRVFHGFSFTDRLPGSGIEFVNKVVEDAGKRYKGVHYDHGNGVAVADVDGDGLLDLYFVNQVGANHLYRNLGGGRFENVTGPAGVAVDDRICVTASFADVDNDGDPDLYVTAVRKGNLLFLNDGQGRFTDATRRSGLGHRGHSSSAVFFDYDRDGLLDLFLTNVGVYTTDEIGADGYYVGYTDAFQGHQKPERAEQSILFRNLGGARFQDVSKTVGLLDTSWTGAAAPLDLNQDGWQDLYVLSMQGHDEYYENVGGERFQRKSREIFPRTPWGTMGIQVFDWNGDGLMDIYLTDMHTDMIDDVRRIRRHWYAEKLKMTDMYPDRYLVTDGNHVLGNALFENQGGGAFREVSEETGAENYWPWGLSTGDFNADGWEDVFIASSMNFLFRYGVNSLLLNNAGREFLDSEFILGVEPRRDRRTAKPWFTLFCDGADRSHPGCKGRRGDVEVWGALGSRSSAVFDLDDDGDLDIVTNDFNSEPLVLTSDLSEKLHGMRYLKIDLEGASSNRDGLGARVAVTAGGRTVTQVRDGQSGYLSQSLIPLYFGLDGAETVDRVEVTWPSGAVQTVEGPLETNRLLTVAEE